MFKPDKDTKLPQTNGNEWKAPHTSEINGMVIVFRMQEAFGGSYENEGEGIIRRL